MRLPVFSVTLASMHLSLLHAPASNVPQALHRMRVVPLDVMNVRSESTHRLLGMKCVLHVRVVSTRMKLLLSSAHPVPLVNTKHRKRKTNARRQILDLQWWE